jgi:endonuclease/exonuclease/phosphatase family metal-dependent hydrolase
MTTIPILLASSILSLGRSTPTPAPAAPDPVLTVMTYNVNYGLAGDPAAIDAITLADPDVVFLQETTGGWESALREKLGASYPYMHFVSFGGAGGQGVLSKVPFDSLDEIPQVSWFPALRVTLTTAIGPVQVLSVHLRPGFSDSGSVVSGYFVTPKVRKSEIEDFTGKLEPGVPTLVVGDFNENEHGKASKVLLRQGFHDGLTEFHPKAKTWRWPVPVIGRVRGRYDHVFYDAKLRAVDVRVLDRGRSDHLPVVAKIALAE